MRLPAALGGDGLFAWRLDALQFAASWDSGEGAYRFGGRWNSAGVRAVYCSLDPATTILEVAVHKGFAPLDRVPHMLTSLQITDPSAVHVVQPEMLPNPNWLSSGLPSAGQQAYGDQLLAKHSFIAIPSVVSRHSWNLMFVAAGTREAYSLQSQERFALDTRLHPPAR